MLKKQLRLTKQNEINEVKQTGKLLSTPLFGLLYVKADDNKLGWIVSKKISKKAVVRNRIRRLLAEAAKKNWEKWKKMEGRGLILVKREIVGKTLTEIEKEWKGLLESFKN